MDQNHKSTVTDNAGKFQLSAKGISDERIVARFLGTVGHLNWPTDTVLEKCWSRQRQHFRQWDQEKQEIRLISKLMPGNPGDHIGSCEGSLLQPGRELRTNASVMFSYSDAVSGCKADPAARLIRIYSQIMRRTSRWSAGSQAIWTELHSRTWMESIQISKGRPRVTVNVAGVLNTLWEELCTLHLTSQWYNIVDFQKASVLFRRIAWKFKGWTILL